MAAFTCFASVNMFGILVVLCFFCSAVTGNLTADYPGVRLSMIDPLGYRAI